MSKIATKKYITTTDTSEKPGFPPDPVHPGDRINWQLIDTSVVVLPHPMAGDRIPVLHFYWTWASK